MPTLSTCGRDMQERIFLLKHYFYYNFCIRTMTSLHHLSATCAYIWFPAVLSESIYTSIYRHIMFISLQYCLYFYSAKAKPNLQPVLSVYFRLGLAYVPLCQWHMRPLRIA